MTTYSQLNGAEQQRWHERSTAAQQRLGLSREAWVTLCDAEHILHVWAEHECNGIIQRDEPTDKWPLGRPRRFALLDQPCGPVDCGYVPDSAAGAMRRAKQALAGSGLMIYWQTDPRGCQVYVYKPEECLARGGDISGLYYTIGVPCFY
nr:hypothetical protein [uncultured Mediterranean phage uvMED]